MTSTDSPLRAQPYNPRLEPAERTNELTIDALCYIYGAEILEFSKTELQRIIAEIQDMYGFVHDSHRGQQMVKLHDHQCLQDCLRKRVHYTHKLLVLCDASCCRLVTS